MRLAICGALHVRIDDWVSVGPHHEQVLQGRRWLLPLVRRMHPPRGGRRVRLRPLPMDTALHAGVGADLARRGWKPVRAQVHAPWLPWRPGCRRRRAASAALSIPALRGCPPWFCCSSNCAGQRPGLERLGRLVRLRARLCVPLRLPLCLPLCLRLRLLCRPRVLLLRLLRGRGATFAVTAAAGRASAARRLGAQRGARPRWRAPVETLAPVETRTRTAVADWPTGENRGCLHARTHARS